MAKSFNASVLFHNNYNKALTYYYIKRSQCHLSMRAFWRTLSHQLPSEKKQLMKYHLSSDEQTKITFLFTTKKLETIIYYGLLRIKWSLLISPIIVYHSIKEKQSFMIQNWQFDPEKSGTVHLADSLHFLLHCFIFPKTMRNSQGIVFVKVTLV